MSLLQSNVIGADTETTGLVYPRDKAFAVSFAHPAGGDTLFVDFRSEQHLIPALQRDIDRSTCLFVFHNAQFDVKMLASAGIRIPLERVDCTVVRACQINEHESSIFPWSRGAPGSYRLEDLSQKYLGEGKEEPWEELAAIFGGRPTKNAQILNLQRAPRELVRRYQDKDAVLALRLWLWQQAEIERQGLHDIMEFERDKLPTLCRAAMRGVRVDAPVAEAAMDKLTVIIDEKQDQFEKTVGVRGFNVNSAPQVKKLFEPEQLPSGIWISKLTGSTLGTSKSGGPSLTADILTEMGDPIAESIVEIRSLIKTRDTFLGGHILGHMVGDRVYPTINQSKGEDGGTSSGRLSYQDPALQQIPNRNKKVAEIVKEAFLPEHGQIWLSTDMNSFEVRVFAHLVALYNGALQEIYAKNPGMDFHQFVADLMGVPRNATRQGEANAKQLNLSMIFNSGNGAIAHKLGLPWEWAEFEGKQIDPKTGKRQVIRYRKAGPEMMKIIEFYHRSVPGVKTLAGRAKEISETRGYIKTFTGRRLRCINGYKSYKQSGLLIQATSADYNKMMWRGVESTLAEINSTITLNTHDSFDASVDDPDEAYKRMQAVAASLPSRVPLLLDLNGVGDNWWAAIKKPEKK